MTLYLDNSFLNRPFDDPEIRINGLEGEVLFLILDLAKKECYIRDYKVSGSALSIEFDLHECRAIKPRHNVNIKAIDKYVRRLIPSRDFGIIVISTNKGLMTQKEALKENIGGSLLAYFY